MLFNLRHGLEQSKVFDGLNRLLREVILASLQGRAIDESQMPGGLFDAVRENQPTFNALTKLLDRFVALEQPEMDAFRDALDENIEPYSFLESRDLPLATVPTCIFAELKTLAAHLYMRTAKLVGVEAACGESIEDHYARFRANLPPGNGNICCVCGTECLAQIQSDADDVGQWRGPYDHILSKDAYPLYGVSPSNLIPICQTCNSKAKLAKDLLFKGQHRRLSFCPWSESVLPAEIRILIDYEHDLPRVSVDLCSLDPSRQEKLDTWDDVYKIKARVEGEFLALFEKVAEDISVSNEVDFVRELGQRAQAKADRCRITPFNYWRARVYNAVETMDHSGREALRLAVLAGTPAADEMQELFFN